MNRLFLFLLAASVSAQDIRLGGEFQVNRYTHQSQMAVSLAAADDGDFVAVWESDYHQDGAGTGVFAHRFTQSGTRRGIEFRVNSYTQEDQGGASASAAADGDFVVVWTSGAQDGASSGVFGRRFSSSGTPRGREFQVNDRTVGQEQIAEVASEANGDFIVVWSASNQDGHYYGVFGRRFTSSGTRLATEFLVNSYTSWDQWVPSVASDDDGDFVVVWWSRYQDGSNWGLFGQRFASDGQPNGTEFQVNLHTASDQRDADVAADEDGDFIVVWSSLLQDGSLSGVFARRFTSAGIGSGTELQVASHTLEPQSYPAVAAWTNGDFVVAWESGHEDEYQLQNVFARRFSSSGLALSEEFRANTYTPWYQVQPAVSVNEEGDFVIAWTSYRQDAAYRFGIFAQRFLRAAPLDVDLNGVAAALSDGVLVMRYLFGLRGVALVSGAVHPPQCSRCEVEPITEYLVELEAVLDIDGDGKTLPLKDGLLVLRYLSDLRGAALIDGAVGEDCTRCDAPSIEDYLDDLDH